MERCRITRTGDAGVVVAHRGEPVLRQVSVRDALGVGIDVGAHRGGFIEGCDFDNTAEPAVRLAETATATVGSPPAR